MADEIRDPEAESEESPQETPEPNEKLLVVFDANDESEALVVKGLLESNGLEVLMSTPESPSNLFPVAATDLGEIKLAVREEDAESARQLIAESLEEGRETEKNEEAG